MHKNFKRSVQILLTFMFALLLPTTVWAAEETEGESFTIVHTNDIHASISEFPHFKTYLDTKRAEGPVLYLNAGDNFSGAPIVDYFQGEPMIRLLNMLGTDAMTIGNHEFDYGQEQFQARREQSNFPWLAANMEITDPSIAIAPWTQDNHYKIFTLENGVKVGVVGIVEAPPATRLAGIKGLQFNPYVETMKKYEFLRDQVDVLVALTHIGILDDEALAQEVDFFDLIIGGHSHTALFSPQVVNGTPIIQSGGKMKFVGEVDVTVTDAGVQTDSRLLSVRDEIKENYAANPEVKKVIDEAQTATDEVLDVRIGSTVNKLDRDNRWEEDSSMGNMITDALRAFTGTEIAITNNGGIRESIEKGDITKKDIFTVDPFDNEIATLEVSGGVLKDIIEFSFHRADEKFGHTITDISSSGLTYTIYYDGPQGKDTPREDRKIVVADLMVNGEPIDLDRMYTVTTNTFLADGGDGYSMFDQANWDRNTYHGKVTEAIIQYIENIDKEGKALEYAYTEGRNVIKHISERPEEPSEQLETPEENEKPEGNKKSGNGGQQKPNGGKDSAAQGKVDPKDKKSNLPKTGEMIKENPMLFIVLIGAGVAIVYFTHRKKDEVK